MGFPLASWFHLSCPQPISRRGSAHPLRALGAAWALRRVQGRYCISPLLVYSPAAGAEPGGLSTRP